MFEQQQFTQFKHNKITIAGQRDGGSIVIETWNPGAPGSTPESKMAMTTPRPSYSGYLVRNCATPVSFFGNKPQIGKFASARSAIFHKLLLFDCHRDFGFTLDVATPHSLYTPQLLVVFFFFTFFFFFMSYINNKKTKAKKTNCFVSAKPRKNNNNYFMEKQQTDTHTHQPKSYLEMHSLIVSNRVGLIVVSRHLALINFDALCALAPKNIYLTLLSTCIYVLIRRLKKPFISSSI